jgi:hypothetical protein
VNVSEIVLGMVNWWWWVLIMIWGVSWGGFDNGYW